MPCLVDSSVCLASGSLVSESVELLVRGMGVYGQGPIRSREV